MPPRIYGLLKALHFGMRAELHTTLFGKTFAALLTWLVVALIASMHARNYAHQYLSDSYPKTPGVVTHSQLVPGGGMLSSKALELRYSYVVRGTTYEGRKIKFSEYDDKASPRSELHSSFPVGTQVLVYYDPSNPKVAALIGGSDALFDTYFYRILAIGLAAVGLALVATVRVALALWKKLHA